MKPPAWWPKLLAITIVSISMAALWQYGVDTGPVVQEPTWSDRILHIGIITESFIYTDTWQNGPVGYYFKMLEGNDTVFIKVSEDASHRFHVNDTYRFFADEIVRDPRPAPYKGDWMVVAYPNTPNTTVAGYAILFTVSHNRTTGVTGNLNTSIDFTLARYDTSTAQTITVAEVYEICGVTVDNITYDIIGKNPDGTYQVEWTDTENYTTNMRITTPPNPEDRTAELRLDMTVDIRTIERMADYETITIHLKVAGVYFFVSVMMIPG